jgi:phosphate starvation-inducible protein PhoH
MSDVTHRVSAEGADPLALAGVNDRNLQELERATGVRVALRGDQFTLAGEISAVERAGLSTLNEGQKISFEVVADRRTGKSSADNLRAV